MRSRIVTRVLPAAFGLIAISCSDATPPTPLLSPPAAWSVTADLRIGSADDSSTALTGVPSLAVDTAGRIFVAQPMESAIRVFAGDGQALGTYGRSGDGPGEFRQINRVGIFAHTLYVSDLAAGRITLFSLDGRLLETLSLSPQGLGADWAPLGVWWLDDEGTAVALPGFLPALRDPTAAYRVLLVRIDRSGEVVDTVALTARPPQLSIRLLGPFGAQLTNQPFATPFLPVISANGRPVAVLGEARATRNQGGAFDVTVLNSLRDTVWSQSYAYDGLQLIESVVDRIVAARVRRLSNDAFPDRDDAERQLRSGMLLPDHAPPVSGGIFAEDGSLWLRREDLGAEDQRWTVLDGTGAPVADVVLPSAFTPHVVRANSLWGVETDELDIPYVVRYSIRR